MTTTLGRRKLLRGALGGAAVSLALPRLGAMLNGNGTAYAQGGALPKRFGVWGYADGVELRRWEPAQTGTTWALSDQLMPLANVRAHVSVVTGMNLQSSIGRGHCTGHTLFLTGDVPAGTNERTFTAKSKSIDQIVADHIAGGTPLRSLEVCATDMTGGESATAMNWFSHNGPNSPNQCARSCKEVLNRLLGLGKPATPAPRATAPPGPVDVAQRLQRSVLDAVKADGEELLRVLGAEDKRRLDQHLTGLREIEKRLAGGGAPAAKLGACAAPPKAPADDLVAGTVYDQKAKLTGKTMAELVGFALSCDLTRVFTFQNTRPGTDMVVDPILGTTGNPTAHDISHKGFNDRRINTLIMNFMEDLATTIQVFRSIPDGAGTLLDSLAMLVTSDVAEGQSHALTRWPILVVGKAGGALRPGVHYKSTTGEQALAVPLTVARAVGAPLPSFGAEPFRVTESLSAITA